MFPKHEKYSVLQVIKIQTIMKYLLFSYCHEFKNSWMIRRNKHSEVFTRSIVGYLYTVRRYISVIGLVKCRKANS